MSDELGNAMADGGDAIIHDSDVPQCDDITVHQTSGTNDRPLFDVECPLGEVTLSAESKTVSDVEFQGIEPSFNCSGVTVTSTDATDLCAENLTTDGSSKPSSTLEPDALPPSSSSVPVNPADGLTDVTDGVNQLLNQTQSSSFESSHSTTTSHDSVETVQSFRHQSKIATDLVDTDFESEAHPAEAANSEPVSVDAAPISDVAVDTEKSAAMIAVVDDNLGNPSDTANAVEQPSLPEEPPAPTAEFKAGITCCDVPTALDILNTRYLLSDVTIHKNMITWSSWNIADMVRGPHRESFWWKGKRRGRHIVQHSATEADQPSDTGAIAPNSHQPAQNGPGDVAVKDIDVLNEKIEQKEREIELMLQRDEMRLQQQLADAAPTSRGIDEEAISPNAAQVTCAQPGALQQQPEQQKRENLFQRLLRALRQRFSRQQHGGDTGSGVGQKHETSSLQDHRSSSAHRRQRTL